MDEFVSAVRERAAAYGMDITDPAVVRALPGDRRFDDTDAKAEYIGALDKLLVYSPAFDHVDRMDTYVLHELDHKYQLDACAGHPDAAFRDTVQALEEGYQDYLDIIEQFPSVDRSFERREGVTDREDMYYAAAMQEMPEVVERRAADRREFISPNIVDRRPAENFEDRLFSTLRTNPRVTRMLEPLLDRRSVHTTIPQPADEVYAYTVSLAITRDTVSEDYLHEIAAGLSESQNHYDDPDAVRDRVMATMQDYRDMRMSGATQQDAIAELLTRQDAAITDD